MVKKSIHPNTLENTSTNEPERIYSFEKTLRGVELETKIDISNADVLIPNSRGLCPEAYEVEGISEVTKAVHDFYGFFTEKNVQHAFTIMNYQGSISIKVKG